MPKGTNHAILIDVEKHSFVLALRETYGETQQKFADRLGVGLRSLKRYELECTEPRSIAITRQLEALAKPFKMTRDPATWTRAKTKTAINGEQEL